MSLVMVDRPLPNLIEEINKDPHRGDGHDNLLTRIELDRTSYQLLEKARVDY